MNTNKITIIGTVIVIILLIFIPTIYEVHKNYQNNLYKVVEEKIIEAAKRCYLDNVCTDEETNLDFLYEHQYLEMVSNPVTKEYYNKLSYVRKDGNKYTFYVVE